MAEINKRLVNSSTSIRKEVATWVSLSDATPDVYGAGQLAYTLADRSDVNNKYGHYFATFNMPHKRSNSVFYSGDTMAKANPEMFQLNVDKIAVIPISENNYSEYIDGRSITLKVPQSGSTYKTIISSFYSDVSKNIKLANSSLQYFGPYNIAFLFSDDINKPYTGTTEDGSVDHSKITTWDPTNDFRDRPSAVSYNPEIKDSDYNKDQRPWSSVNKAVYVNQAYPKSLDTNNDVLNGYNYDIPVGFVCLDKGYIVLTHPDIVNNIPWTAGSQTYQPGYGEINAGRNIITGDNLAGNTEKIVFTGMTSTLTFEDISVKYLTSVVCIAMPGEFFISTNPTWPLSKNLAEIKNGTTSFDSIFISQVGLYNIYDQLIAVAKLDRPVEKTYDGIISFNLEINI